MFSKRSSQWPRGCWPDDVQRLLLRACLLDDRAERLRAWESWRRRMPLDFVDGSSMRMLPLLHDRLRGEPGPVPDLERLAGIARYYWVQSQLLHRDTVALLRLFNREGVETMLLKGAALNATVCPIGLRPMTDIDIVIRRDQIELCLELLTRHEWKPRFRSHSRMKDVSHATHLTGRGGRDLDLHWTLFHERYLTPDELEPIWNASVSVDVGGEKTRVLCAGDQLLHTCEHGVRYDETPPFRWLADAYHIVHTHGDAIDWQRCARLAHHHGLLLPVRQTLQYLKQHLQLQIPAAAWGQLNRHHVSLRNRAAQHIIARRQPGTHPFWQTLPRNLLAYARWRKTRRGMGLGEYVRLVNDLGAPFGDSVKHFSKLSTIASWQWLQATLRSAIGHFSGQTLRVVCLASEPPDRLEGFYAPELCEGRVFRWTYPNATLRLSLTPGDYQAEVQLLPARELRVAALRLYFNRSEVACETIGNDRIRFPIAKEMFVRHYQQRLVLGCSRWHSSPEDPRQLGLPIVTVEFQDALQAAQPASTQQAHAA